MPGPNRSRRRRRAIDRRSAMHGRIETAAAGVTETATAIATAAAGTDRDAIAWGDAMARGATVRVTPAATRGATAPTAMLPHARETLRDATARGAIPRAVTPRFVRKDRAATRPAPINRRAPTAPLAATSHLGQAIVTRAGNSVRAASERDAADVGVDVVDAMGARTP